MSGAATPRAWAELGVHLIPIPPGRKAPIIDGWPARAIGDPDLVEEHWKRNPRDNMGAVLGPSKLVSFDVDAPEHARRALAACGFDLDAILEQGVAIEGNPLKAKRIYRAPDGDPLPVHKLSWPPDPASEPDANGKRKRVMVLELRAGGGVQDVLPPSIHPDTKQPYRLIDGRDPWTLDGFPEMPGELLRLWRAWPTIEAKLRAACPWSPVSDEDESELHDFVRRVRGTSGRGDGGSWDDVRREVLSRLSLREALHRAGVKVGTGKFSCPIHPPDTHPSAWVWTAPDGLELLICAHGATGVGVQTRGGNMLLDAIGLEAWRRRIGPGKATAELAKELGVPLPPPDEGQRFEAPPRGDEEEGVPFGADAGRRKSKRAEIPKPLRSAAIKLARQGIEKAAILEALEKRNEFFEQPVSRGELEKLTEWALGKVAENAEEKRQQDEAGGLAENEATLNDLGNARRLVHRCGNRLRYSKELGEWLSWDGRRWLEDRRGIVPREAHETANRLLGEAMNEADKDKKDALVKWWRKSGDAGRIAGMLTQARALVPVLVSELDVDPYLLNVQNGIVDLRTGELLPHDPARLLTKLAPVAFDAGAAAPRWLAFLDRIFAGDEELIGFMQRALGYALTGDTSEQCVFVLYGAGANGKSTMLGAVRDAAGDYFHDADMSTFTARQHETDIRADLAALKGRRCVAAVEANEGSRMNESLLKRMTGGEQITCRVPHGLTFSFAPAFKLFIATNHELEVRGTDEGIRRRIRQVPFTVAIPAAERDPRLAETLRGELPGILAWLVRGAVAWWQERESGKWNRIAEPPDRVQAATSAYFESMDRVGAFLEDCCVRDAGAAVSTAALRAAYEHWCKANGEEALAGSALGKRMREKGFESVRGTRGARRYPGLLLVETDSGESSQCG